MSSISSNLLKLFTEDDKIFQCYISEHGQYKQSVEVASNCFDKPFTCLNPVKGKRRLKSELATYRNFLFEDDNTPISRQLELLSSIKALELARLIIFSGSKSMHIIVSCADDLRIGEVGSIEAETRYKQIWEGLKKQFEDVGLNIDPSGKNPSTLFRTPGAIRVYDTRQEVLHEGCLLPAETLKTFAVNRKVVNSPKLFSAEVPSSELELDEILKKSISGKKLRDFLQYPTSWISAEAGNYPMIFRLTAWAIDVSNPPPEVFINYFKRFTEPYLHKKNYFKEYESAILGAYRHKGVYTP